MSAHGMICCTSACDRVAAQAQIFHRREMQPNSDLIFGILAVQLHLASPQQLVAAGTVLASQPGLALGDILVEQGVLAPRDRELLDELLARQVAAAGGDTSKIYERCGGDAAAKASFSGSRVFDSSTATGGSAEVLVSEQPGRYKLRGEQGRGAIGRVLIAFDESIHREIALKELLPSIDGSPNDGQQRSLLRPAVQTTRFLREARITGQLEHPGIVPVYELGQRNDGTVYYTMKLVRGATLADKIKACRNLTDRLGLLNHFLDLCQAIAYAHSRGVIHRDIKPANVMVGEFGETVLLDWGLAKVRGQVDEGAEKLADELRLLKETGAGESVVGKPLGTPSYMPPEQAEGRIADVDERSDVWSLGAVLYELLTGRPPFTGATAFEVVGMVLKEEVRPVLAVCKEAPPELAAVAMRCLKCDPQKRYHKVEQLAGEVKEFQTGGLVSAYTYNAGRILIRWAGRHWPVLATAGVALALFLATGALAYSQIVKQRNVALAANQRLDSKNTELLVLRLASESREQLANGQTKRASLIALEAARFNGNSRLGMTAVEGALRDCAAVPQQYRELLGHANEVLTVAFSPDGKYLATGSGDATLRLWYLGAPGFAPRILRGHSSAVNTVAFSPDGKLLAAGSGDATIRLWNMAAPNSAPRVLRGHEGVVLAIAFSPDSTQLASGSYDQTIRLWDLEAPAAAPRVLLGHIGGIAAVAFSPDGKQLASGGYDSTIRLWNLAAGDADQRVLRQLKERVNAVAFSPDGKTLASGCADNTVLLLNLTALDTIPRILRGHGNDVMTVAFSPDGHKLASGSLDSESMICLWDLTLSDAAPRVLHGHEFGVKSVAFSPDGKQLATGSMDAAIRLWDLATPERSEPRLLLSAANVPAPTTFKRNIAPEDPAAFATPRVYAVACSPDGKFIAAGNANNTIRIWELAATDAQPRVLTGHLGSSCIAFSPDCQHLASGNPARPGGSVNLWDLDAPGNAPHILSWYSAPVDAVAFSPRGNLLAAGCNDMLIYLWNLAAPETAPIILRGHTNRVKTVAFSPDGKLLASGGWDNALRIWDLARLDARPRELSWGTYPVHCVVFSPDSKLLASANADNTVRIWDLAAPGSKPRILTGHRSYVLSVAFSPDGKRLASASNDQTVRLWDMTNLTAAPSILRGHTGRVNSVTFSPDGQTVISGCWDGTVRLWRTQTREIAQLLQGECYRNLTQAEWNEYIGPSYPYESTISSLPPGAGAPGGPPMEPSQGSN